jgi:PAS domain S-box-containing protein
MARPQPRHLVTLIGFAAVYILAGKLGLALAVVNESASAVWPPTGIALAACLLFGVRVWPALTFGAFVVNFTTSGSMVASMAIAAGNTLEGIAGAWLIARYANGPAAFDSARDTCRFAVLAAVATAISASIGAATLAATGLALPGDVASVFVTWWIGDMVGAMLVAPPFLLWSASRIPATRGALEIALLTTTIILVPVLVFGGSPAGVRRYPLEFLTIAGLLWCAFRFGAFQTSIASAVTSVIVIWGTLHGYGPFARSSPNESLLLLQAFMGVVSIVSLAVAAEVVARRNASASLRLLNDSLEGRIASRTEELVRLHGRLAEAQSVAHVGSWQWEVPSNSLWWSEELYRIYGIPKDTAAHYETFLSHVHPADRARIDATVQRALADGQPFAFEHRIIRGDGVVRTVFARGRVSLGPDGTVVRMSGVGHDITELKQAEEERAQLIREQVARREAEEANRAKDQFLATLSHELRTPMNAVLGWAHMMRELPLDDERRGRAVDAIFRNVQIQSQLVSDILDVSRITTGTLNLETGAVNLSSVVDEAIDTVRDAAAAKRVTIDVQHPPVLELRADAVRLRQIVWNLVANAVKFVGHGGRVWVVVLSHGDAVEIVVDDDGPGIAPEFLPHMFDRFRQADGSLTREHGGLGLGLAIVRHLVELHGGTVAACNRTPSGASFSVRLPVTTAGVYLEAT